MRIRTMKRKVVGLVNRLFQRTDRPVAFTDKYYSDEKKHVRSVRKLVEFMNQRHSSVSIIGLVIHTAMEGVSVGFYIWISQLTAATTITEFTWLPGVLITEVVLNIIFLVEWICMLFFEEDKKAYLLSWLSLVNILTSVPMIIVGIGSLVNVSWRSGWVPMYLRVWWLQESLTALLDYPQIAKYITDINREMDRFIIRAMAVLLTCVGTHQIVESTTGHYMDFYNSFYMMVVAFGTIGFGDVTPLTTPARIFMWFFIIIGIGFFLPLFQRLAVVAEQKQFYTTYKGGGSGSWLRQGWKHPHVIICGLFSSMGLELLLRNFYSGWRRYLDTCVVVMSPEALSNEVRLLTNLPWLKGRVTLLVGNPEKAVDLDRAKAREADAIFLFGNALSSAYYEDYTMIAQSLSVALYDRELPQHLWLRRNRNVRQIAPYAASVLEIERTTHHLLGLSMSQPGVIPLVVNLLRTYEPVTLDLGLARHWVEQYEYSLRNDLYGLDIPDALRGREFRVLVKAFFERDVTLIGILNVRNVVQLNPRELIPNARKLILIAKTMKAALLATEAIARNYEQSYGEEMLVAPDPEERARQLRGYDLDVSSTAEDADVVVGPSPGITITAAATTEPGTERAAPSHRGLGEARHYSSAVFSDGFSPLDDSSDSDQAHLKSHPAFSSPLRPPRTVAFPGSPTAAGPAAGGVPVFPTSPTQPRVESLVKIEDAMDLEHHFLVIDLSTAKAKDKSSRYAQEAASTAAAHDFFNVILPIRQAYPEHEIVFLTDDVGFGPYFDYYWRTRFGDGYGPGGPPVNPIKYIFGCGLNTTDLRRCNIEHCAGCTIFFAGDISRGGSTSAMSMLVVLSINEIMQGTPSFPVVVELEGLVNLPLFPPYADDPRLRAKAEVDFVYEPNFIMGNALSRLMLYPSLQRTYFMEEFIDVIDVLISGHTPDRAALARLPLSLVEVELETYEDVINYCLKIGFLPISLQRRIADVRNPSINGQYFVLTNPPHGLRVHQRTDILFYITPN